MSSDLLQAYGAFTDVLMRLGRPRESARRGERGSRRSARSGSTAPCSSQHLEALLAIGAWDEADSSSAAAIRVSRRTSRTCSSCSAPTSSSAVATSTPPGLTSRRRSPPLRSTAVGDLRLFRAELALWERRWTNAAAAISEALASARRARPHSSTSGSAPRDCARRPSWQRSRAPAATRDALRAGSIAHATSIGIARGGRGRGRRPTTPNAGGWLALAEAEHERAHGHRTPESWSDAAASLGAARAPTARGVLPLAPGRGAGLRRRDSRRGEHAAQGGTCSRDPDGSRATRSRARAARPTCSARSGAAGLGT